MARLVTADEYRAMHEGKPQVERANEDETLTITVTMRRRWIPIFLGMLRQMQMLGSIGSSRHVLFFADGDGDFRPKFEWSGTELDAAEPTDTAKNGDTFFDAG